jgi:putative transcriptional regulator
MANKRLRKELLETARGLYDLDAIDAKMLRELASLRVEAPKLYTAYEIKRLRLREKASQAVFAAYLNTSVSTVQKWEVGDKKPSGPALKLLDLVARRGLNVLDPGPASKRRG